MIEAQRKFVSAVTGCVVAFNSPANRKLNAHLSPRFYVVLLDLAIGCENEIWPVLRDLFSRCAAVLGDASKLGSGTPCGDALTDVYDTFGALFLIVEPSKVAA